MDGEKNLSCKLITFFLFSFLFFQQYQINLLLILDKKKVQLEQRRHSHAGQVARKLHSGTGNDGQPGRREDGESLSQPAPPDPEPLRQPPHAPLGAERRQQDLPGDEPGGQQSAGGRQGGPRRGEPATPAPYRHGQEALRAI